MESSQDQETLAYDPQDWTFEGRYKVDRRYETSTHHIRFHATNLETGEDVELVFAPYRSTCSVIVVRPATFIDAFRIANGYLDRFFSAHQFRTIRQWPGKNHSCTHYLGEYGGTVVQATVIPSKDFQAVFFLKSDQLIEVGFANRNPFRNAPSGS
jgi:hypothetical protein